MFFRFFKRQARRIFFPLFAIGAVFYFVFHLIHGDRGIHAWMTLLGKQKALLSQVDALKHEKKRWHDKIQTLQNPLHQSALEHHARKLGYGHDQDIMVPKPSS